MPYQTSEDCAFPKPDCATMNAQQGMSLRDYFAPKALAAIILGNEAAQCVDVAHHAYSYADAMLKARE